MAGARRLFIGASGPIGYDYDREYVSEVGPVPVLEDLTGILLCYDELIFLSRDFCPPDMWELPYVSFFNESGESTEVDRLQLAFEQFRPPYGSIPFRANVTHADVVSRLGGAGSIDNHSHRIALGPDWSVTGNAGDLELLIADMGMAAALELPRLDVLNNSIGADRFGLQMEYDSTFLGEEFGPWHIGVAQQLAMLKVPNVYASGRTYIEEIEDLRSHPNIQAFRDMLSERTPNGGDVAVAATEISAMADDFARRYISKRFERSAWYTTLGKLAVGPVGNLIHPGLGVAASGTVKVAEYIDEREDRRTGAWAAFVVDLER